MGTGEMAGLFTLRRRGSQSMPGWASSATSRRNEIHDRPWSIGGEKTQYHKQLMASGYQWVLPRLRWMGLKRHVKEQPDDDRQLNEGGVTVNQKILSSGSFRQLIHTRAEHNFSHFFVASAKRN
jgi:hypothetical protein